ncbi:TIGR02206 family membrane protein [candidate division KSB1 bacterium]|nr:TIGR02206 family membrane protein [candidate division KSB1 bacterium]RQW02177.1 MAG: TIGR02206 family membrane protein [candidate division KSB1 bacterium]
MKYFFAKDFAGPPFELFKAPHLVALTIVALCALFLLFLRKYSRLSNWFRCSLGILLVVQEISYHLWNIYIQEWTLQKMLPLHVCTVFVWLSAFMLFTKNRFVYEFAYFLGIAGALQALLTPDIAEYGFPHYRFFHVFISHGAITLAALYMTIVEGYRPTWRSFGKVFLWLNIYVVFVYIVNVLIGSNYMFVLHKPETASLLDVLGPWPVYIFVAEGVALVMFLILYLPFAIYDWRKI